ncbi:MAG: hypothetical protein E7241_00265 [Lachnospiraceae bacterium]|nr:hypothetical protein [Lachnospiraceae bacterium]
MLIIKSVLFIVIMTILSMVIGKNIVVHLNIDHDSLAFTFICGLMIMLATFLPVALICTFARASLTILTVIWIGITLVICAFGLKKESKHRILLFRDSLKKNKITILILIVLLLILIQVYFVVVNWHSDADDATYVGIATTSLYSDSINQFNPLTGAQIDVAQFKDYILAPFSIFWAMIAKLFAIHPAIVMHTLMPIIFIPFSYMVYFLIGRRLLKDKDKTWCFLLFVALINIFGNWSIRSTSTFLLFRIWQGKAVLCSILIPLTVLLLTRLKDEGATIWDWLLLFLCMSSACLVSGMGPILMIPLLVVYMVIDLVQKRNIKRMGGYLLCGVPLYIIAGLYALLSNGVKY